MGESGRLPQNAECGYCGKSYDEESRLMSRRDITRLKRMTTVDVCRKCEVQVRLRFAAKLYRTGVWIKWKKAKKRTRAVHIIRQESENWRSLKVEGYIVAFTQMTFNGKTERFYEIETWYPRNEIHLRCEEDIVDELVIEGHQEYKPFEHRRFQELYESERQTREVVIDGNGRMKLKKNPLP